MFMCASALGLMFLVVMHGTGRHGMFLLSLLEATEEKR